MPKVDSPAGEGLSHVIFIWHLVAYFICVSGSGTFLVKFVISLLGFAIKKSKHFKNKQDVSDMYNTNLTWNLNCEECLDKPDTVPSEDVQEALGQAHFQTETKAQWIRRISDVPQSN